MQVELIKKIVVSKDDESKHYTNIFLKINGVDRMIQIKPSFDKNKSDFILLVNLATLQKD